MKWSCASLHAEKGCAFFHQSLIISFDQQSHNLFLVIHYYNRWVEVKWIYFSAQGDIYWWFSVFWPSVLLDPSGPAASSHSSKMLASHIKFIENSKWFVGVRVSVDGCLCLCGPEVNWQLIQGVTCPRPEIAGSSLPHATILKAGQRWWKMNGRMFVKWIIWKRSI